MFTTTAGAGVVALVGASMTLGYGTVALAGAALAGDGTILIDGIDGIVGAGAVALVGDGTTGVGMLDGAGTAVGDMPEIGAGAVVLATLITEETITTIELVAEDTTPTITPWQEPLTEVGQVVPTIGLPRTVHLQQEAQTAVLPEEVQLPIEEVTLTLEAP